MAINLTSGSHLKQLSRIANDYNVVVSVQAEPGSNQTYLTINGKVKYSSSGKVSIDLDNNAMGDHWAFGDTEVERILMRLAHLSEEEKQRLFTSFDDLYNSKVKR